MGVERAESQDTRIGRIVNEFLDRRQRGEAVSEEELIQTHADIAGELREHFGMIRQVMSVSSTGGGGANRGTVLAADCLPGYEIQDELHRGGQGVVYLALQKATRRRVAIKVTREGPFAGWRDRARFEREVHVLASLRHPSIVTIHDSGVAAGSQYFVMDYVSGAPLDVWLTREPRSIEQILQLFVIICDAINAAHIKGIIHRDLKPGNIRIDDQDQPHILDFGLAKLSAEPDPEKAGMTAAGQFVGSLPWTSPEQAQGSLDQVDTRTDVYALGVILYQMLTGAFPYETTGPVRDVLNRIVGDEPIRPGTLRRGLDRDVEAIVLKCLSKEPHRRYQTAGELGRDVSRFLSGQPVAARGDSGVYVLTRLLRRYRVPVAVAAAFALLITASLLASLSLWRRAVLDRDRAVAAEQEQDRERRRADAKATEAEHALRTAELARAGALRYSEELRGATYLNRIALARNALEQNSMSQARRYLALCEPDLREWEWYYLSRLAQSPALLDILTDQQEVLALAISPDGQRVASGGDNGVIRIWDAHSGAAISELKGHSAQVKGLAYSPDGQWLASGGLDKSVRLWDVRSGASRVLEQDREYVRCVAFSPDSSRLVYGGQSKVLTFRDVSSGQVLFATSRHDGEISCAAYTPDGAYVASGELQGLDPQRPSKVRLWNASTGQGRTLVEHATGILSIAISPDGERIASGSSMPTGTLKVCERATGREIHELGEHDGYVAGLAFSPDGSLLASTGGRRVVAVGSEADRTLTLWDAATGEQRCTYSAHKNGGKAVVWRLDPQHLFSGGRDGRLALWPSTPPPEVRVLAGQSGPLLRVAFSPDGRRIASSGGVVEGDRPVTVDNTVRVWDAESGSQLLSMTGHQGPVEGLAWSADGTRIASADIRSTLIIWDSRTGARQRTLSGNHQPFRGAAFGPTAGDAAVVAGFAGNAVTLWKVVDGSMLRRFESPESLVAGALSPDGRWMAIASIGGEVRVLGVDREGRSRSIQTGGGLKAIAVSPDARAIASAHTSGDIHLWDTATGTRLVTMAGPRASVDWIAFSPSGRRIASCGADNVLRIWDVQSANEVFSLRVHDPRLSCAAFSPVGHRLATCGEDGTIRLLDGQADPVTTRNAGSDQERWVDVIERGRKGAWCPEASSWSETPLPGTNLVGTWLRTESRAGANAVFRDFMAELRVLP